MTRQRAFWLVIGLVVGITAGFLFARFQARMSVMAGPYSDDYGQARRAISQATDSLRAGNTNVFEQLQTADTHLSNAQRWARRFIGDTDDAQ